MTICNLSEHLSKTEMEPGIRKYLIRIVNTLSLGLLWLALNSTAGIMYDLAFVHEKSHWEIFFSIYGF